jgi:hypothetical protein
MRSFMLPLAATVLTVAWLFSVPTANAQTQSLSPGPSERTPKSIPDQKLDAAAAALEQVASLKEDYQRRIKAADPSDRDRIAEEAHSALVKAVTDRGLSSGGVHLHFWRWRGMILMFAKKSFSASIRRPSSCNDLSRVDHSETVKWYSDVMRIKQKSSPCVSAIDSGITLTGFG